MDTASFFKTRKKMQEEFTHEDNYTENNNLILDTEIKTEKSIEIKVERLDNHFEDCNYEIKNHIVIKEEVIIEPEIVNSFNENCVKTIYECLQCEKVFYSNQSRSKHYKEEHNTLTCKNCNRTFNRLANLNRHLNYVCPKNEITVKNNNVKKYGMYTHKFICDLCKTSFTHKNSLVTHMKSHLGTNLRYKCKVCSKSYTKKHNLKCHILSRHSKTKTYLCKICNKKFGWRWSLNCHEKTKHGINEGK